MRFRVLFFCFLFPIFAFPASLLAQTISGSILDSSDNPVGGGIRLFLSSGEHAGDFWTNELGEFQTWPLANGSYRAMTIHTRGVLDEAWSDIPCVNQVCDVLASTAINMEGSDVSGIDFVLDPITMGGRISGLVEDSGHSSLADVGVEIRNSAGEHLMQVATGADGTYTSPLMANDTYYVQTRDEPLGLGRELYDNVPCLPAITCDNPVFVATNGAPVVIDSADRTGISFTLTVPAGAIISGQVTDAKVGIVLPDVHMNLLNDLNQFIANTNTDPQGNYYFSGLADGTYKVYAVGVPEGYSGELYGGDHCQDFGCDLNTSGTPIVISGGVSAPGKDIELDYSGTRLLGTITRSDSGLPVSSRYAHAGVDLFSDAGDYMGGWGTNRAGQYQIPLVAGNYYLVALNDWQYHGLINEVWQDIQCFEFCDPLLLNASLIPVADNETVIIDFELEPGFQLLGAISVEGSPTGEGHVTIWDSGGLPKLRAWNDGGGNWVSAPVPAGTYYATVRGEDFGMVSQLYRDIACPQEFCDVTTGDPIVVIDSNVAGIDFDLSPASNDWTISGSIRDSDSNPVNGGVRLFDPFGNRLFDIWTDPLGNFRSDLLANGTYFAFTFNTHEMLDEAWDNIPCENMICDITGSTPIVVDGSDVSGIDFVLEPIIGGGRISGVVTDGSGIPLKDVAVVIKNSRGEFLLDAWTLPDGNYQSSRLANDNYFLHTANEPFGLGRELYIDHLCLPADICDDPGYTVANGTAIEIADADRGDIDFTLEIPAGAVISGKVTDAAAGHAMPDVHMNVLNEFNQYVAHTNTDPLGDYYFSGLPDGNYKVYAVGVPEGYTGEFYGGDQCPDWNCDLNVVGTPIIISSGVSVSGRDIGLDFSGTRLFGTVTRSDSGLPVSSQYAHMGVDLFNDSGQYINTWPTNRAGQYQIVLPGAGSYFLVAANDWNYHGLVNEAWEDIQCWECDPLDLGADLVMVPEGGTTIADFVLEPGFNLSGTIRVEGVLSELGHVNIWNAAGLYVHSAWNDGAGNWQSVPMPAATYFLTARGEDYGLVSQLYDGIACPQEFCDVTTGDPVVVTNSDIGGINFDLTPVSNDWTISGSIKDAHDNPVGGAVRFFDPFGSILFHVWVDQLGNFQTPALADGAYYAITMRTNDMLDEAWENFPCVNRVCDVTAATPIIVAGGNVTGIDFVLDPITSGGHLSGLVENAAHTPLPGVSIVIRNSDGGWLIRVGTGPDGRFRSPLMANDTYFLHTRDEPFGLGRELFDDVPCPVDLGCGDVNFITTSGTPVMVEGSDETGLDFLLELPAGGLISGRVRDADLGMVMPDVSIALLNSTHNQVKVATTDALGDYYFSGLGDGDYKVYAVGVPEGYAQELYGGDHCPDWSCNFDISGATITVSGGMAEGRDIDLDFSGTRLLGAVTRSDTGAPVTSQWAPAFIELSDSLGEVIDSRPLNFAGQYQFVVPPGDYFAVVLVDWDYHQLINEAWEDIRCETDCNPLVVGATLITVPENQSIIVNFELDPEVIFRNGFDSINGALNSAGVQ